MSASTEIEIKQPGVFNVSVSGMFDYDIPTTFKCVPATTVRLTLWVGGVQQEGAAFDVTLPPVLNFAGLLVGSTLDGTEETFAVTGCQAGGADSSLSGGETACGSVTITKIPKYAQTPTAPMLAGGMWMLTSQETAAGIHVLSGRTKLKPIVEVKAQVLTSAEAPSAFPFVSNWMSTAEIKVKVTRIQVTMTPLPVAGTA